MTTRSQYGWEDIAAAGNTGYEAGGVYDPSGQGGITAGQVAGVGLALAAAGGNRNVQDAASIALSLGAFPVGTAFAIASVAMGRRKARKEEEKAKRALIRQNARNLTIKSPQGPAAYCYGDTVIYPILFYPGMLAEVGPPRGKQPWNFDAKGFITNQTLNQPNGYGDLRQDPSRTHSYWALQYLLSIGQIEHIYQIYLDDIPLHRGPDAARRHYQNWYSEYDTEGWNQSIWGLSNHTPGSGAVYVGRRERHPTTTINEISVLTTFQFHQREDVATFNGNERIKCGGQGIKTRTLGGAPGRYTLNNLHYNKNIIAVKLHWYCGVMQNDFDFSQGTIDKVAEYVDVASFIQAQTRAAEVVGGKTPTLYTQLSQETIPDECKIWYDIPDTDTKDYTYEDIWERQGYPEVNGRRVVDFMPNEFPRLQGPNPKTGDGAYLYREFNDSGLMPEDPKALMEDMEVMQPGGGDYWASDGRLATFIPSRHESDWTPVGRLDDDVALEREHTQIDQPERFNRMEAEFEDGNNNWEISKVSWPAKGSLLHEKWKAEDGGVDLLAHGESIAADNEIQAKDKIKTKLI